MKLFYLSIITIILSCASPEPVREIEKPRPEPKPQRIDEDSYYEVTATGISLSDAELEAKLLIIEKGIGALVDGGSKVVDAQLQYSFVSSSATGYVRGYERISEERIPRGHKVRAKGKVSLKALGNALEERKREIGNPKMMILMTENLFGNSSKAGFTKSEIEFQRVLKKEGFQFDDEETIRKILAREKELQVGAYGNPKAEELALKVAAELNTDILVIGNVVVKNGGELRKGTGLYSIQSDMKYKLVNVGNGGIMASATDTGVVSDVDESLGATEAIKKNTEKLVPEIKTQIGKDWQQGSTTRMTFKGLSITQFLKSGISESLAKIRGVNAVDDRGNSGVGYTVEVKCFCSSAKLSKEFIRRSFETDYEYEIKELKGNLVLIDAKKGE